MGFYELGNGCDSCDTISSIIPTNVNMQSTPSYLSQASMMSPYGTQGTSTPNVSQYIQATSSGYPQTGTNMGSMGTGSSGSTMGATTMTTTVPTTIVQTIPNMTTQMKQVTAPGPAMVMVPAKANNSNSSGSSSNNYNIESFSDGRGMYDMYGGGMTCDKKWIILGLIIFSALASNECCKYFLNKSLQLNDGSPMYYLAYAGVAILLTFAAHTYISKN